MSHTANIHIQSHGKGYVLVAETEIARPLDQVFCFFADAMNLDHLTPGNLRFEVLTPQPIVMKQGLLIDYRIRLHRVPIHWTSEIVVWDPPHRFVDEQRRGPYRWWHHEHRFEQVGAVTKVIDEVDYGVLGGGLVHRLLVERDLRKIFTYRATRLLELLR